MDITIQESLALPGYSNLHERSSVKLPMSSVYSKLLDQKDNKPFFVVPTALTSQPLVGWVEENPHLTRLTGLVVLEVVNVSNNYHLEYLREQLKSMPYVLASFLHWNYRDRLFVIFQTKAETVAEYMRCHVTLTEFVQSYNPPKPQKLNKKPEVWFKVKNQHNNITDFIRIGYDPLAYYNKDAEVMEVPEL